jgi:hypothetical protein
MPRTVLAVLAFAAVLGTATPAAAEVFVTKDAQGRPIYTDRPDRLPAEKLNVATKRTDVVEVQGRYQQQQKTQAEADKAATDGARQSRDARQASESNAADKAKRCQEARDRYQTVMTSQRLYEEGATPEERRYLTSEEVDAARADSKKVMDEFCADK